VFVATFNGVECRSGGRPDGVLVQVTLAVIARKVALAFRIAAQGAEAGLIEDAGDGA
jgi:hypothetical protein